MTPSTLETRAIDLITALIPWLAPAPSAYLVYRASIHWLEWPEFVAFIAAAIIEGLGITTVYMALALWSFNQDKRKSDNPAPTWLAVMLAACYLTSTIGLTVVLDIAPDLSRYAPAIFPLLALVGAVNLALRSDHQRRLADIATDKAERYAARHKPQIVVSEPVQLPLSETPAALPKPTEERPYACEQCSDTFESSAQKANHIRWHHPKNAEIKVE